MYERRDATEAALWAVLYGHLIRHENLQTYYPLNLKSLIQNGKDKQGNPIYEDLLYENTDGYMAWSSLGQCLPTRYGDTVRIYRLEGESNSCMKFARVKKPDPQHDPKPDQGLEDVQGGKVQSAKVVIEGELYIIHGGKLYDAQGKMIKK